MKECKKCNGIFSDSLEYCPDCHEVLVPVTKQEVKSRHEAAGKLRWWHVLLVVLILLHIGGAILSSALNSKPQTQEYSNSETAGAIVPSALEEYVPGEMDGSTYISKTFGFKIVPDANWEYVTPESRNNLAQNFQKGTDALYEIKSEDNSQSRGLCSVVTISDNSLAEGGISSAEAAIAYFAEDFKTEGEVKTGYEILAGEKTGYVDVYYVNNSLHSRVYVYQKGNTILMVYCIYPHDDSQLLEHIKNQIVKY